MLLVFHNVCIWSPESPLPVRASPVALVHLFLKEREGLQNAVSQWRHFLSDLSAFAAQLPFFRPRLAFMALTACTTSLPPSSAKAVAVFKILPLAINCSFRSFQSNRITQQTFLLFACFNSFDNGYEVYCGEQFCPGKRDRSDFFMCNLSSISLGKVSSAEPFLKRGEKRKGKKNCFRNMVTSSPRKKNSIFWPTICLKSTYRSFLRHHQT